MRPIDADALIEKCGDWYVEEGTESGFIGTLKNLLATMPTIQPQSTAGQLNDSARSTAQSTDLIDRQAARHALCKAVHKGEDIPCENQIASCLWTGTRVCDFVREIDALPPTQPETAKRIVGKSRDGMTLWYQCDMCDEPVDEQDNYCRGCGRRLIDG